MASYRELLAQVRAEIDETTRARARALDSGDAIFVDVRERAEWDEGHVPGAVHIPRGSLEDRAPKGCPDRARAVVVYCAGGRRSAFAAETLEQLGYSERRYLTGGFDEWEKNGFPVEVPHDARRRTSGAATAATS